MEIDLSKVVAYASDWQNRTQMRSIMLDMYPDKTRDMNILLAVLESGIPNEIKNNGNINDSIYIQYVQRIIRDYGLQEEYAIEGINTWIDQWIGLGVSSKFRLNHSHTDSNQVKESSDKKESERVSAESIIIGNRTDYVVNDLDSNRVEIIKFQGFDQSIMMIPYIIDGKKVVGIAENAFRGCKAICKLFIVEGIEYIDDGAFAECDQLSEVTLPSTLIRIGTEQREFSQGDSFKHLTKQNSIGAFAGTAIREISLPEGLAFLGEQTFFECSSLCRIDVPRSIERLRNYMFCRCKSLSRVNLNEGLVEIGHRAFHECRSLKRIIIPSTVKSFGDGIFDIEDVYVKIQSRTSYLVAAKNKDIALYCYSGTPAIAYARKEGYGSLDATKIML